MDDKVTVKDCVGLKDPGGDQGLELEVEFRNSFTCERPSPSWSVKPENSLRNFGIEFVTNGALAHKDRPKELATLIKYVNNFRPLNECPRASFHVHQNVLDLEPIQVYTYATCYWLVENLLFKYCGESQRKGNLFCLRLSDAPGLIGTCIDDIENNKYPFQGLNNTNIRYAGINLNAVPKFGSVEFRGMRCILDAEYLDTWCRELNNMLAASKSFSSPLEVVEWYLKNKNYPSIILNRFFSLTFVNTLTSYKDWDTCISENEINLLQFAYEVDWDGWKARYTKTILDDRKNGKSPNLGKLWASTAQRRRPLRVSDIVDITTQPGTVNQVQPMHIFDEDTDDN